MTGGGKEPREELEARLEEALGRINALESELGRTREDLKRALEDRAPRGLKHYLAWACWSLLVLALGAYLYKFLAGAHDAEPLPRPPLEFPGMPKGPAAKAPVAAPEKPGEKKPGGTKPAEKKPGGTKSGETKLPKKEGESLRFPGFGDLAPETRP